MLPGLYPLQQIIVYYFVVLLMDFENLITGAQEVRVLFVLQIFDSN